ncbi:MAG: cysteine dioxygenase family protein [Dehalococcoidia bacterium]
MGESSVLTLAQFLKRLKEFGPDRFRREPILRFLRSHRLKPGDLRPFLRHPQDGYTRNLIYRDDLFLFMACCWASGGGSPIHDHHDQLCWMMLHQGRLTVTNYRYDLGPPPRLEALSEVPLDGERTVALADREQVLHRVMNPGDSGELAVSLHIYSRPFDSCLIYDPQTLKVQETVMTFDSIYGQSV